MSRVARQDAVAAALAALDDAAIAALLDRAMPLEIAGVPVFVKRVPLTALERAHARSTANLFELPTWYQYGIGSAGFGAWRELAAQEMTTAWVRAGTCPGFPLLYHHRVLGPMPDRLGEHLGAVVAWWDGSPAVRARLEAMASAPASLVLVLEYVPYMLVDWLNAQAARGDAEAACAMVERSTDEAIACMREGGLVHFDAHFSNLLTDGDRVYFADFGLASARAFALSEAERAWLTEHADYDGCLVRWELVRWLTTTFATGLPAWAAAIVQRHGPVAALMTDFLARLRADKRARYPRDELAAAYAP